MILHCSIFRILWRNAALGCNALAYKHSAALAYKHSAALAWCLWPLELAIAKPICSNLAPRNSITAVSWSSQKNNQPSGSKNSRWLLPLTEPWLKRRQKRKMKKKNLWRKLGKTKCPLIALAANWTNTSVRNNQIFASVFFFFLSLVWNPQPLASTHSWWSL